MTQSLYTIIYDWFQSLLNGSNLNSYTFTMMNQTMTLQEWLSTFGTLAILVLIVVFFIMCTIWLFKFVGGLFKW